MLKGPGITETPPFVGAMYSVGIYSIEDKREACKQVEEISAGKKQR
jgi:hypothetical protein